MSVISQGVGHLARAGALCVATLVVAGSLQAESAPKPGPIPVPEQPGAISLGSYPQGAVEEQWFQRNSDNRDVRNVSQPTLTPVLPDPAKANGTAVIVAPGGGFLSLSMDYEGYLVADWLAEQGVAAFVLKYRTKPTPKDPAGYQKQMADLMSGIVTEKPIFATPEAVADASAAVKLVRARATEWKIDPTRVGFVGFSAGGMTALDVGLVTDAQARPDFIAPIYPPMMARDVPDYAPPMFVAIALDDPLFAAGKSTGLIDAWRKTGAPVEAHLYSRGGHGFGMKGSNAATAQWNEQFYAWMEDQGFLGNTFQRSGGKGNLSVADTTIKELLDNPQAKAVLQQYVPKIANSPQVSMMGGQTLLALRPYTGDMLSDELLQKVQTALDAINAGKK